MVGEKELKTLNGGEMKLEKFKKNKKNKRCKSQAEINKEDKAELWKCKGKKALCFLLNYLCMFKSFAIKSIFTGSGNSSGIPIDKCWGVIFK